MRRNWKTAPVVTIPVYMPACPECGAGKPIHLRGSKGNGDADSLEDVRCRRCSLDFRVERIWQIAELANAKVIQNKI
jgi:hypothetical protein